MQPMESLAHPVAPAAAPDTPLITEARSAHVQAMQVIYAHYVQTSICTMEELAPGEAEMHRRHDALRRQGLPWLVAVDRAQVVGYAYAGRYRPRVGYGGTVETSIYIHPEHHGRGLGQLLLEALIRDCQSLGLRQMLAVIVRDPETQGSIRLHQRLGFRQAGVLEQVGRKFGRSLDTLLMQRSLCAA